MTKMYAVLTVAVVAIVTALLRFLPFIVFKNRQTPKIVSYLGRMLPYAVMGMLVVYCLKGVTLFSFPHGLPELIACLLVVFMHIWKRNTLLSILVGTVSYMVMIQLIF